jgi:hypothetical protein
MGPVLAWYQFLQTDDVWIAVFEVLRWTQQNQAPRPKYPSGSAVTPQWASGCACGVSWVRTTV